jgi:AmmeMemoRadiSam system protein B
MTDESIPDHLRTPHLRRVVPIMMLQEGRQMVAIRDPLGLSERTVTVNAQTFGVVQLFQGQQALDRIAEGLGASVEQLLPLVKALDEVGLLWGPTFTEMEEALSGRIAADRRLPKGAAFSLGEDAEACRAQLAEWLAAAEDPELEGEVCGIVAPHLDYGRGASAYAAAYRALEGRRRPDRVVILGTNHFGIGDGVVLSEWGFRSPLGDLDVDEAVVSRLQARFGKRAFADQLDHVGEHSIQLHLPWIHHLFGPVPVVAALVPDPLVGLIENDGERIDRGEFIAALGEALEAEGGDTLVVASSDLSHVGPQFGEPRPVDETRRGQVEQHDRELLRRYLDSDATEFVEAMEWNRNPTRWCSIGNMAAAKELLRPQATEFLEYHQACDDEGVALVSCAAIAFVRGQ